VQVVESGSAGTHSELRIRFCEDIETIYDQLEVSSAASASLGKVASVEAKVKFVRSLRVTSTTLTVLINARVTASNESVERAEPRSGLVLPTDPGSAGSFFESYGDCYVSRLAKGAEYVAAYAFYSQTTEEREQVKASLKAMGIVDGVTLTAKVGTDLEHAVKSSKTRYLLDQTILGRGSIVYPKPAEMIDFALNFAKKTPGINPDAVVLAYDVSGYERLGVPWFENIRENRRRLQGDNQDSGVSWKRSRLFEVRNQARWLKAVVYPTYGSSTDQEFDERFVQIEADLNSLGGWLDAVGEDPTTLHPLPPGESLKLGVPVFAYRWVDAPSWGGPGGKSFHDIVATYAEPGKSLPIGQIPRLSTIAARGGDMLDSIRFTYTYNANLASSEKQTAVFKHGGTGGRTDSEVFQLNDQRHISSITVQVGTEYKYIQQIHLKTTGGQSWTFPAKIGDGGWGPTIAQKWDVPQGQVVVGFAGSSGDYLDRLEPLVIQVEPPKWEPHRD
jgi:hypothetical protein